MSILYLINICCIAAYFIFNSVEKNRDSSSDTHGERIANERIY